MMHMGLFSILRNRNKKKVSDRKGNVYEIPIDDEGYVPYSCLEERFLEKVRSPKGRFRDVMKQSRKVYPKRMTPEQALPYWKAPNRSDVDGLDAPEGSANMYLISAKCTGCGHFHMNRPLDDGRCDHYVHAYPSIDADNDCTAFVRKGRGPIKRKGFDIGSVKPEDNVSKMYHNAYPEDTEWGSIKKDITFSDVLKALNEHRDLYQYIGVNDSVIRENIFMMMCSVFGKDYDHFYRLWLGEENNPKKNNDTKTGRIKGSKIKELNRMCPISCDIPVNTEISTVIDPAHVALTEMRTNNGMSLFNIPCTGRPMSVNICEMAKAVDSKETYDISMESDELVLRSKDKELRFKLSEHNVPKKPNISMDSIFTISDSRDLSKKVERASSFAESVRLSTDGGDLRIDAGSDSIRMESRFDIDPVSGCEAESVYPSSYLNKELKAHAGDHVRVEMSSDFPMRIRSDHDGIEYETLIAPRLEAE